MVSMDGFFSSLLVLLLLRVHSIHRSPLSWCCVCFAYLVRIEWCAVIFVSHKTPDRANGKSTLMEFESDSQQPKREREKMK